MFQYMCLCVLLTFHPFVFAGKLPKELGNLVNLVFLYLNSNESEGEFVCSVLHSQFGHVYDRVSVGVCTVTEEEKTALKAQLPDCEIYF